MQHRSDRRHHAAHEAPGGGMHDLRGNLAHMDSHRTWRRPRLGLCCLLLHGRTEHRAGFTAECLPGQGSPTSFIRSRACQRWINGEEETYFSSLQTTTPDTLMSLHTSYYTWAALSFHPSLKPWDMGITNPGWASHFSAPNSCSHKEVQLQGSLSLSH